MGKDSLRAINISLDELDISAQKRYLLYIIQRARAAQESILFQYDLDGQSHWDGQYFLLDVGTVCYLRMATSGDIHTKLDKLTVALLRHKNHMRREGLELRAESPVQQMNDIGSLTVDELHSAISYFAVHQVLHT